MLGKGRRVEDDEVVLVVMGIEILERIVAVSLVTAVAGEVQGHIEIGQFDGLGAAVYRVDRLGTAPHGIYRKTARVAEHVEYISATGIVL